MPLDSGSLTFTIPSYLLSDGTYSTATGKTQSYLTDLEYPSGFTAYPTGATATSFTFMAIGSSRLAELKKYGSTGHTQTLTSGTISGVTYTGYTIDGLSYKDMANGYTQITGNTANYFTTLPVGYKVGDSPTYATEYVMNKVLTRNEHFLGFVEQPEKQSPNDSAFIDLLKTLSIFMTGTLSGLVASNGLKAKPTDASTTSQP